MPLPYAHEGVEDGQTTKTCPACGEVSRGASPKLAGRAYAAHFEREHPEQVVSLKS